MTTRYLSVFLPHLPTDRLKRQNRRHTSRGRSEPSSGLPSADPLVTVAKVKGAQRIAAVDEKAAGLGIKPGMALADARAMIPALVVIEADVAAEAETATRIVDWCRGFTPLAAPDGPDGVLLDIGGVTHLFGGEPELIGTVEANLGHQGFWARAAVASTPEAAWALARFAAHNIAPAPNEPGFERLVADLPLAALNLDENTVSAMRQAGLRRVGDLLLRPRAPIAARFGAPVFARLDGLMGRAKASIVPRFAAPAFMAERRFASGIAQSGDVQAALLPLCRHLCAALERQGKGARRIEATLFRVDGAVKRIEVGTSRPIRDPHAMMGLFRERIAALGEDGLDTGYGFDLIRLGVPVAETLANRQETLAGAEAIEAGGHLADLADRLGARLGSGRVLRLADGDTHIPESAMVAVPVAEGCRTSAEHGVVPAPRRPIRLFDRPEPIETIAAVPDGPPVRFRWRRVTHEIAAIEGPERIASEWWKKDDLTRDYFQAEDREGRRYWLFREGLFNREAVAPRWYVHGLFG